MWMAVVGAMMLGGMELPTGPTPEPVAFPHFPDRLHAFVWRNWWLVSPERMGEVVGADPEQIVELGRSMGLEGPPAISEDQKARSYITIIRRNWHLLNFEQLEALLGMSEEELAYILREDDFLWIKLGSRKPKCEPLRYAPPSDEARQRASAIAEVVREAFPNGAGGVGEPLFSFVRDLSSPVEGPAERPESLFSPRFCYSYFALYGDPLMDTRLDPYPDGLLARLARTGVDGVWLQGVLYKLAPFPWDESLSEGYEERLKNLGALVARARKHGIGIYLYLNEPRAMPLSFYESRPELKGVVENDFAALCSEVPEVREYLSKAVAGIVRAVPDLAGFFTISASENLTNCWSHMKGADCPRCSKTPPEDVIANVHRAFQEGIEAGGGGPRLLAWDWGWRDDWAPGIIERLPVGVSLMSVSEWSMPINRGGVDTVVGEYSISSVGPGPRATRHWGLARARGLDVIAKVQAGNTWELSTVPYIPAVENVARHAANLREAGVGGIMLGWTLGGYPSPNLEVFAEIGRDPKITVDDALHTVAARRYGEDRADAVVEAWKAFSRAFSEYPYNIGTVYAAPVQAGPSNLLWAEPTGYGATMVGLPYDDLTSWRSVYPAEVFIAQFRKMAEGFEEAIADLRRTNPDEALEREIGVAEACAVTFRSVANQSEFITIRQALAEASADERNTHLDRLEALLDDEIELARRMHALQSRDSRLGFEATNQYTYIPGDLAEKVLNARHLKETWLASLRAEGEG